MPHREVLLRFALVLERIWAIFASQSAGLVTPLIEKAFGQREKGLDGDLGPPCMMRKEKHK